MFSRFQLQIVLLQFFIVTLHILYLLLKNFHRSTITNNFFSLKKNVELMFKRVQTPKIQMKKRPNYSLTNYLLQMIKLNRKEEEREGYPTDQIVMFGQIL